MEEAVVFFGLPVALFMLGVPFWYAMGECKQDRPAGIHFFRWLFACALILVASTVIGLIFGIVTVMIAHAPAPRASQVFTDCRILSSGIDLRATKLCLPQVHSDAHNSLNMHSKFRCYFEYYWASVFKVEFKPYLSGLSYQAAIEIPREALPAYCRPGFGSVWSVKGKYQVNGTYPCKYTPGKLETVEIDEELFPNCRAEEVHTLKLVKQMWILLFHSEQWIFSTTSQAGLMFWKTGASVVTGAFSAILVVGFVKTVHHVWLMILRWNEFSDSDRCLFEKRVQITCVFVATLFGAIWYSGQILDLYLRLH